MRPLHIRNTPADNPTKIEIKGRLQKCKVNDQRVDYLIKEISAGNIEVLDELLASVEEIILNVMLGLPESSYSIDDRLSHTKATLRRLALMSSDHPSPQFFEKFFVFHVKQSLLALETGKIDK